MHPCILYPPLVPWRSSRLVRCPPAPFGLLRWIRLTVTVTTSYTPDYNSPRRTLWSFAFVAVIVLCEKWLFEPRWCAFSGGPTIHRVVGFFGKKHELFVDIKIHRNTFWCIFAKCLKLNASQERKLMSLDLKPYIKVQQNSSALLICNFLEWVWWQFDNWDRFIWTLYLHYDKPDCLFLWMY